MNKENKKTVYSFNASGTIAEWLIIGFAVYGVYKFITELVQW